MLREQGDVAVAFVKDTVRRTQRGIGLAMMMLACSLVAIDAFGQPLDETSEESAAGHPPMRSLKPCAVDQDTTEAWRERIEPWIRHQQWIHGLGRVMSLPETICVDLKTREQVGEYIDQMMDAKTVAQLGEQERILRALNLLPAKKSYAQILRELLTREVSGYYEPEDQTLYLVAENIEDLDASVVHHEIQHLAQDLAWDLQAFLRPAWHQSDVLSARSALVEGDAMFTYFSTKYRGNPSYVLSKHIDEMRDGLEAINTTLLDRYPRFVLEQVTMPYIEGLAFVRMIYAYDQWYGVNAVYDAPPASTAEILYPERYRQKHRPTWLHYELSPQTSGVRRYSDVWGLLTLRQILRATHAPDDTLLAADRERIDAVTQEWVGDRIELWRHPRDKHERMVWLIALSNADAARGLFDWMVSAFEPLLGSAWMCAEGAHGRHCGRTDARTGMLLEQWGDLVLWVRMEHRHAAIAPEDLLEVADEVFGTLRRTTYPEQWHRYVPPHRSVIGAKN